MKWGMRAMSMCVAASNGATARVSLFPLAGSASRSLSSCAGVEVLAAQSLLLKCLPPGTYSM